MSSGRKPQLTVKGNEVPNLQDTRNELAERVKRLRELIARRERQGAAFPIIEAARKELRDAESQLEQFDRELPSIAARSPKV